MRSTFRILMALVALTLAVQPLHAQNEGQGGGQPESRTGGRTSLGFNASLGSSTNSDNDDYTLQGMASFTATHFTGNGRFEYGVGLSVFGNGNTVNGNTTGSTTFNPNVVVRVNSNGLGRDKAAILYAGGTVGANVLATSSTEGTVTNSSPSYGFQLGMNQFLATNAALNIQGDYIFSSTTVAAHTTTMFNFNLSIGLRVFFGG